MEDKKQLFPALPEDITAVSDAELAKLREDFEAAKELVLADDPKFLEDVDANEVIAQFEAAALAYKSIILPEVTLRAEAHENFVAKRDELAAQFSAEAEEPAPDPAPEDGGDESSDKEAEVVAEAEEILAEAAETVEEPELVTASAETAANTKSEVRFSRTPPMPDFSRKPAPIVMAAAAEGTPLLASGSFKMNHEGPLDDKRLADVLIEAMTEHGPAEHNGQKVYFESGGDTHTYADGRKETVGVTRAEFDGPKVKAAKADFGFPEERTLSGNTAEDAEKIRAVLPTYVKFDGQFGELGGEALVASGGLCAPLEPIYTMPNFASEAEPVWDALPVFRARRGGVNVPAATYIGDITTAISSISEDDDAQGGTFATKSCQDLACPTYTETAIQILAHCREYGNLNARAWPEKIAHENALTMAALARTSERFMLGRIKSLAIKTNSSLTGLSGLTAIVDVIEREIASIRYLLRMGPDARFRLVAPVWLRDLLLLDTVNTQFDRYRSKDQITEYLRATGVDPVWHLDNVAGAVPFSAETTGTALECFPTSVQFAIYAEGALLGIDSGVLELGIVRDSTLNSTNDFQVFGERFRNVAKLGPDQAIRWHTLTLSPNGVFPALGTAYSCTGGI